VDAEPPAWEKVILSSIQTAEEEKSDIKFEEEESKIQNSKSNSVSQNIPPRSQLDEDLSQSIR
jgi:hypothetical protein